MQAIVQERYGPPEVLAVAEVDRPVAREDQVLVRVRAASVNPADLFMMAGEPYVMRLGTGLRRPRARVRGYDFAGTVEQVGAKVTGLQVGDEVFGSSDGAFAEFVCAKPGKLAPKPAGITYEQAAALPIAGLTALQALRDHGKLQAGQRVLIFGAGGGVGSFAVQIAKGFGAEVTGVCSTGKVDLVRSIGADHVIDYTQQELSTVEQRYDLVLDNASNLSLTQLRRLLTARGTLVLSNGKGSHWFGPLGRMLRLSVWSWFLRQRLGWFVATNNREDLVALADLVTAGTATPVIDRSYPLSEAAAAMRQVATGHATGKLILTTGE
jgi:NADPH:quinone reductase-like Zn-dependent oxidoreductase